MTLKLLASDGDVVRFEAAGKITRDAWTNHKDPLAVLLGDGVFEQKCLIGMGNALYIDSTGVEWLLKAHHKFVEHGGLLILHSPTPATRQLLKVMRMDLVLNIVGDERQALELACRNGDTHARQPD